MELARVWNELREEEKAPYVSEYTKLWKEFKVEMKNYLKSKKIADVIEEKEGEVMEERDDVRVEGLETDDVEVNMEAVKLEVNLEAGNLEAGNLEVNMEAGNLEVIMELPLESGDAEVNMEEIVQEAGDYLEEEDLDDI